MNNRFIRSSLDRVVDYLELIEVCVSNDTAVFIGSMSSNSAHDAWHSCMRVCCNIYVLCSQVLDVRRQ